MEKHRIKRFVVPIFDMSLITISYVFSYVIRFDFNIQVYQRYHTASHIVFFVVFGIHLFFYYLFRIQKTIWSKTSLDDFLKIIVMNVASAALVFLLRYLQMVKGLSYSVILLMLMLNILGMYFSRVAYRYLLIYTSKKKKQESAKRVLIYGAGSAGRMILSEILENPRYDYHVVGLIDDDVDLHHTRIMGTPILGGVEVLDRNLDIDEVFIAMPSVSHAHRQRIINSVSQLKIPTKIVTSSDLLIQSSDFRRSMRPLNVLDLLGRPEIVINDQEISNTLHQNVIMVTGAGGSIGSELVRQIVKYKPKKLILIDIHETGLYGLEQELMMDFKGAHLAPVEMEVLIKSIRDFDGLDAVFEYVKPDVVFHAAAHKHVPLMEKVPEEAIKNNILGTHNLIQLSIKHKVKRFVNISTDKAVNPTNVMGASKRFNEMMLQAYNKVSDTQFVAVRFGNVLGSNGSVIPLFQKQIEQGGPLTVTHPDITRYFMTIPEAVSLVLQSVVYAQGGEIFVLDMGEPVRILELAEKVIEFSGYRPYKDIQIEYVGLRPGEKLYEELLLSEEGLEKTPNSLIYIARPLNHSVDVIESKLFKLKDALNKNDVDYKELLKEMVPSYVEH